MSTNLQPSLLSNITPLPSRECCSACGQRLPQVYPHVLSIGLVSFLWVLYRIGPGKLEDLPLDLSTANNAQKVRYWGLAYSEKGVWNLSPKGFLFLGNRIEVEERVWTKQAKVVERSEKKIRVQDVDEGWWQKIDYSREAKRA